MYRPKACTTISRIFLGALCTSVFIATITPTAHADGEEIEVAASPKHAWEGIPIEEEPAPLPWYEQALLWIPNRLADLLDVVKIDVGVGPAAGGVVRVTKYGQAGVRGFAPASLRVGLMGRRAPVMLESSFEGGIGPAFAQSNDREICDAETGISLDLFIAGASAGICWDEAIDLVGGLFFLDPKDDDFK